MTTLNQYPIEKLNVTNYGVSETDMQYILLERNCVDILEGKVEESIVDPTTGIIQKDVEDYCARR